MKDRLRRGLLWLIPSGGVAERTVKSAIWVSVADIGGQLLQVTLYIVLARLLDPADFGLMGIALITIMTLKHFTNLGIDEALIQKEEASVDSYLNTVLTMELSRGALMTAVILVGAPYVAAFFSEPRATDVLRVVALSPLLLSLKNPGVVYFQKELEFHKETAFRLSYSGTRFVVGIVWAAVSPTVWALVVSFVVADVVQVAVSYLIHDYRPWPEFDLPLARDLVDYGKWITGGSILYLLYSQGDDAVVGWLLGAASLGFYQLAYQLGLAPGKQLSGVVRKVMFPSYAQMQNDLPQLRETFFRSLQVATFVGFPAAVGIAAVAPSFVRAFLGTEWTPMVTTLQLLAAYGLVVTVTNTFGPVWKALNRPDLGTKLGAVRVVLMAIAIIPMTQRFGIEGAAGTVVALTLFPMLPLDAYVVITLIESSWRRLARELFYPMLAVGLMGICVFGLPRVVAFGSPLVEFLTVVCAGVVSYAAAVGLLATTLHWDIDKNLRSVVNSVR